MKPVYLDNNATTPLDPRVLEAMMPYFTHEFGNAASRSHPWGWRAEEAVEAARAQVAAVVGADPREIIFTSGATESDNLALIGAAEMYREKGNHIITVKTEHKAVLDTARYLETRGFDVTYLDVAADGLLSLEALEAAMTPQTILVSVMAANNEIGVIQDLAGIGSLCHRKGILFHTDAAQAVGRTPIDVQAMGIDLMSMSAHKMYGPKGVGALYVRRKGPRVRLSEQMHGGGHERGMRSGTMNVPSIVGFGKACELLRTEGEAENKRILALRDRLHAKLTEALDEVYVNGHLASRLCNNLNMSFAYVEGESLLMGLNEHVALSSGSACTSATLEPSYVLKALGVGDELAHSSLRFGLGRFTTEEDIDSVVDLVVRTVRRLRDMSPLYEMVKEGIDLKTVQWAAH